MQSLYYYSGSLTGSNLYLIPNNDDYTQYNEYNITNLIVCSSLYQILVYSGSSLLFSFPIENTNLYYIPTTESFFPSSPFTFVDPNIDFGFPPPTASVPSSSFNYIFTPDTDIISSNNKLIITGSSVNIIQSQSSALGFFQIESGSAINIIVSGSGNFYNSSILIYNDNLLITSSYTSSLNSPLLTSFTPSFEGYTYSIFTETTTFSSIELTYNSSSNIPVSPTNSLDDWNSYLNISASSIINTGSSVYLLGGDINTITSLTLAGTGSEYLNNVGIVGAEDLIAFVLTTGSLTSFPTLSGTPNLQYIAINSASLTSSNLPTGLNLLNLYNIANNNISGSILNIIQNVSQSIQTLDCSFNNLTGSIPTIINYPSLTYLNCSYNKLSGGVKNPDTLAYYNCSNNQLSGSMLNSFAGCYGLYYFDCSNNAITDDIPNTDDLISLNYFDVSNNQLSGSFINLRNSTLLNYIDYSNNQITDEYAIYNKFLPGEESNIPPYVTYYNCSYNFLSGTLDLSGSSNLVTFICNNNQFSGSLTGSLGFGSFQGCTSLETFIADNNDLGGGIYDLLYNNPNLKTFSAKNNRIDDLVTFFSIPSTLTYFDLENNNLSTASVVNVVSVFWQTFSGSAVSGTLNISGSGNAPVSGSPTVGYLNILTASGWTIYANDYP